MAAAAASSSLEATLLPPPNFSMVWKGVYRSSYPTKKNFPFLQQLGLRTLLFLCPEEYHETHRDFLAEQGIALLQFGVNGNKEPFDEIPEAVIRDALQQVR
jgi:tyrosine-protein phosphatase SIW14|tara:strand:- start:571 stop:873 length:303 start_codon:yes stop_codon:yes gene_type:complete